MKAGLFEYWSIAYIVEVGRSSKIHLVFFIKYPADLTGSLDHSLNMKPAVAQWSEKCGGSLRRLFNNMFVDIHLFPKIY